MEKKRNWVVRAGVFAALVLAQTSQAAIPKLDLKPGCQDRISNLYLSGSFSMPGTGEEMTLWVGKPTSNLEGKPGEIWGVVGKGTSLSCEAQCKVTRFERFKKDLKPALMELDCEGPKLHALRMPIHIQWVREKKGFETVLRMGSSIYGMEEAALKLQVNRYSVASK